MDRAQQEKDALAQLRIGGSFWDAMKVSHLTYEEVVALWRANKPARSQADVNSKAWDTSSLPPRS